MCLTITSSFRTATALNRTFAEVTGEKENRGAGYGLEIPCVYHPYGPKVYIDKMKES